MDDKLEPQRQMVEAEEVSADGLTWTFRLRPSLRFHDGEPVLAKDAVASINRWAARDGMGQMIRAIENELVAIDDRTFRWALKRPYPKMLLALGKTKGPWCFVMPTRIAATDPFRQIGEYIGSGPMRFVRTNGCLAPKRYSRNSPATRRARSRHHGSPAARTFSWTVSSG